MALFDFGKKKQAAPAPPAQPAPPQGTPTDKVVQMQQAGSSNNQIVQQLQGQGYSQTQIYDALNQAAAKRAVSNNGGQTMQPPPQKPAPPPSPAPESSESTEELVESIIEDKWKEFKKKAAKEQKWKEDTETRLVKLEQTTSDLRGDLDNLHKAIVGKIGEYDRNLLSVGTEIKAMEKVFQKILPTLSDNVSELSKITKKMKK